MAVGDTPVDLWNLVDTTNSPIDLSGVSPTDINFVLRDFRTGMKKAGQGEFTVINASQGQLSYAWASPDTVISGNYRLSLQITFPSGQILSFGLIDQVVQPILVL